jgi:hypothetical protein
MRGQSAILNLLTLLTLAGAGVVVVAVALLFVAPGAVPGFLRVPTEPVQVSGLTAEPTATAARAYPTLPPEWTATPSPQPSPSNTAQPVQTATPSASPRATGTLAASTPAASATRATSATPAHVVKILTLANVRSGPGTAYPVVAGLSTGETAPVIGRDSSAQWFAISVSSAPQGIGWVSSFVASYDGSVNDLPVIQAAAPPPPSAAPPTSSPGPPTATNLPNVGGANGIQTLLFQMHKTTGAPNEDIFFDFQVVNTTASTITYGILAAHTDQGVTADSWLDPLLPGKVLTWTDHINFPNTGTYYVYLGICYSSHDACKTGGAPWTRLSASVAVTII